MLFSILIANYNNGSFFKDCYNSIINQTYQNFEIIIYDDASTDNSVEVIRDIIKNDARFKLTIGNKNNGCGFAKAKCAALATGDLAGFLDPDDALTTNALQIMVEAHNQNKNASIIGSKYYYTDLNLNIIKESKHASSVPNNTSYLIYGKGAIGAFASFKLNYYKKTIGLNPSYKRAVDQDLNYLLEEVGETVFVDEFLYLYRINDNSISANKNLFKAKYWHNKVINDTYNRRKSSKMIIANFTDQEMKIKNNAYLISRMQHEAQQKKYSNKYYFLLKSIILAPTIGFKYKLLCLLKPKFY